jgi:hypothetical protein
MGHHQFQVGAAGHSRVPSCQRNLFTRRNIYIFFYLRLGGSIADDLFRATLKIQCPCGKYRIIYSTNQNTLPWIVNWIRGLPVFYTGNRRILLLNISREIDFFFWGGTGKFGGGVGKRCTTPLILIWLPPVNISGATYFRYWSYDRLAEGRWFSWGLICHQIAPSFRKEPPPSLKCLHFTNVQTMVKFSLFSRAFISNGH